MRHEKDGLRQSTSVSRCTHGIFGLGNFGFGGMNITSQQALGLILLSRNGTFPSTSGPSAEFHLLVCSV
jgi:hypothetical protein